MLDPWMSHSQYDETVCWRCETGRESYYHGRTNSSTTLKFAMTKKLGLL